MTECPRKMVSMRIEDFHTFVIGSRSGGFVVVHPGRNTQPSYYYIDELGKFIGNERNIPLYPGIERISFGDVCVQAADEASLKSFLSEINSSQDLLSRLPVGLFITQGRITYSSYLPAEMKHPSHIGHYVHSIMQMHHIIPQAEPHSQQANLSG